MNNKAAILLAFNHLNINIKLNYIYRFSSYRPVNTHRLRYKNQAVQLVYVNNHCCEIGIKHICVLCGQEVEFLNAKSGGKYSNH